MKPDALPASRRWRGHLQVSAGAAVLATAAQTLGGMVLYGYLIRRVGAEAVGVWVSLMAAGLLACMADMGLNHVLIRQLSITQHDRSGPSPQETVETLLWSVAVFTGVALIATYLAFPLWSAWLTLAPDLRTAAHRWLPFVLVGLWLNRIADALAGGLDGQQRFVERSASGCGAMLFGLLLTMVCVPVWGMDGAAAAFVAQNATLCLANFVLLVRGTPGLHWLRPRFRPAILRDAVRYGLSVQGLVLCYLLMESGVKLSFARSGDLSAVSYFDLAFRMAKGVRGLLGAALRVLVPRLAPTAQMPMGPTLRASAYASSFGVLLVVALPIFAGLLAAVHAIAWVMTGRDDAVFVHALVFALLPWLVYSLTDPALNLALASGRMQWALRGHLVTLALVTLLGWWWNVYTSYKGLYTVVTFAMIVGCVITLIGIHRDERMSWRLLRPGATAAALTGALLVGGLGVAAPDWLSALPVGLRWSVVAGAYLAFVGLLWWRHPSSRWLFFRVRTKSVRGVAAAPGPTSG